MAVMATTETGGKENNTGGKAAAICKLVPRGDGEKQRCVIKDGKEFCRMTLSRRLIKWCKIKIIKN